MTTVGWVTAYYNRGPCSTLDQARCSTVPADRDDLHDELMAMLAAGREMPPADDEHLVDTFLDRLDGERPLQQRSRSALPMQAGAATWYRPGPHDMFSRGTSIALVVLGVSLLALLVSLPTAHSIALLFAIVAIVAGAVAVPNMAKGYLNYRHDQRTLRQEKSWLETGVRPPLVLRTYTSDIVFQHDASRLLQLGYKIQAQQNVFGGQKVTYVQDVNR
jgi:hypothetical protein